MVNNKLRKKLPRKSIVFDNPSFDNSIIGVQGKHVIYDFDLMVEELASDDNIPLIEAQEFIEYNTLRTMPYINIKYRPIIKFNEEE